MTSFSTTLFVAASKASIIKLEGEIVIDMAWNFGMLYLTTHKDYWVFVDQPIRLGRTIKTTVLASDAQKYKIEFLMSRHLRHDDICELL